MTRFAIFLPVRFSGANIESVARTVRKAPPRPAALALATIMLAATTLTPVPAVGATPRFIPQDRPELRIPRTHRSIRVDGHVEASEWNGAARVANFTEVSPGDQTPPPVATEVFLTYDNDRLYIAFIAHDPNPEQIRASLRARDQIFNDDYVGIVLDTWGNAAWAYELYANPFGIQGDRRWTPSGEDIGFDVVFESKGRITESGYEVEMAVPFKSLRFPVRDTQRWRATFQRIHPRDSRRLYSWATISRDNPCFPCQFGTLTGLRGVHSGSSLELLPSLTGTQSGQRNNPTDPKSGFSANDPDAQVSLGARYAFSPSTAAEFTINPDFSQVESDAAQVDINTTFALFFPERRPFFQEGSDLYRSFFNVVYTRQINDPSVAAKFTRRTNRTSVFYLFGRDEETPMLVPLEERSLLVQPGKSVSNIARARVSFGKDNFVGAVATDRRYDEGGSNTVGGVDASVRFQQNYRLEGQALVARTREPNDTSLTVGQAAANERFDSGAHTLRLDGESFAGTAYYAHAEREARHWNSDLEFRYTSPRFRADNGFITRNSERRAAWENAWVVYPDNAVFDRIEPNVLLWQRWNGPGQRKGRAIENNLTFYFKGQTSWLLGYDRSDESFRGHYFRGVDLYYTEVNTSYIDALRLGFWFGIGDRIARTAQPAPFLGEGEHLDAWGTIKIGNRLVFEPLFTYSVLRNRDTKENFFKGSISRLKVNYQFTRELFLRLVTQYDDFSGQLNVEPLLTYQINPFSVFYVGASTKLQNYDHKSIDPSLRTGDGFEPFAWQAFFKLQYFYRF